jgi:hypothetical protein
VSCPRLVDQPLERTQLRLLQCEVRAVGQQQVRLIPAQRDEDVGEWDLMSLDGDGDAEVEPVGVARHLTG